MERVGHRELIVIAGGDGRVAQRAAPQTEHQVADDDQAPANPVLEAGAAAIPIEVLEQAKALTAALPEAERDRLLVWFIVRMIGSIGMIGPEDIEFEDQDDGE